MTYRMVFTDKVGSTPLPVEGCRGHMAERTAVRVHFLHWNVWDIVVILEEGSLCGRNLDMIPSLKYLGRVV